MTRFFFNARFNLLSFTNHPYEYTSYTHLRCIDERQSRIGGGQVPLGEDDHDCGDCGGRNGQQVQPHGQPSSAEAEMENCGEMAVEDLFESEKSGLNLIVEQIRTFIISIICMCRTTGFSV